MQNAPCWGAQHPYKQTSILSKGASPLTSTWRQATHIPFCARGHEGLLIDAILAP